MIGTPEPNTLRSLQLIKSRGDPKPSCLKSVQEASGQMCEMFFWSHTIHGRRRRRLF